MSSVDINRISPRSLRERFTIPESIELASDLKEGRKPAPSALSDLPHEDIFSSMLSITAVSKLGLAFGSVEGSFSRKIFIQDYVEKSDKLTALLQFKLTI